MTVNVFARWANRPEARIQQWRRYVEIAIRPAIDRHWRFQMCSRSLGYGIHGRIVSIDPRDHKYELDPGVQKTHELIAKEPRVLSRSPWRLATAVR